MQNQNSLSKERIARFIKRECIEYSPKESYFFGKLPGARYKSQFYLSRLLYNQELMKDVAEHFHDIVEKEIGHWNFQLAGREWSAIPLLMFLPQYLEHFKFVSINSFMIKRDRKTYGIHNYIEGQPNNLPVLMVDDLCNSTNSFIHCKKVIQAKETGLELLPFIFAVLNKKHYEVEDTMKFDKYLGSDYKALSVLIRNDVMKG